MAGGPWRWRTGGATADGRDLEAGGIALRGSHCECSGTALRSRARPHCGVGNTAVRCWQHRTANTFLPHCEHFLTALRRLFTAVRYPHPRTAVPSPPQCGAITPSHCGAVAPALRRARTALRGPSPARADRTAGAECDCVGCSYCVGCSPAPSYAGSLARRTQRSRFEASPSLPPSVDELLCFARGVLT